jgi:hypothetical protein
VCRFVNLNYLGLHKILKKHDKKIPDRACRQFYIAQLHKQPWLAGHFSDVLVRLSNIFSSIRGDSSGIKNEDAAQVFNLAPPEAVQWSLAASRQQSPCMNILVPCMCCARVRKLEEADAYIQRRSAYYK